MFVFSPQPRRSVYKIKKRGTVTLSAIEVLVYLRNEISQPTLLRERPLIILRYV